MKGSRYFIYFKNFDGENNTMKLMQGVLKLSLIFYQWMAIIFAQCNSSIAQMVSESSADSRFSFTFLTYPTIGRELCIKECMKYPSCVSVNFQKAQLKCELVSFSSDANSAFLLEDFGFEHIVINRAEDALPLHEMSMSPVLGSCIEVFYKCVVTKSGTGHCLPGGNRQSFKNIALNKPAESSSVWGDNLQAHSPLGLTDGDQTDTNMQCPATKPETHPWFRIDLLNVHQVDHVIVYTGWNNRAPCNAYQVRVGKSATWSEMTSCGEGSQAQDETIVCKDCLLGRYVQLQLISTDSSCHIVTCEIEVIGSVI